MSVTPLFAVARLLRPYWGCVGQSLGAGVILSLLALPGPYLTKVLIDDVYPHGDLGLLHFLLTVGAVVSLLAGLTGALSGHFGQRVGVGIGLDLQERLYRHLQSLDFGFFDRRETGEVLSRFDDLQASVTGVVSLAAALLTNLLQLLIFPAVLFYVNWRLALVSVAVLPLDTLLAAVTRVRYGRLAQRLAEEAAALSARAYESLASIRVIQALGVEASFLDRLRERLLGVAGLQLQVSLLQNGAGFAGSLIRAGGTLAYGWYGWSEVVAGRLSLGTFMAFSGYAGYLYGPIQALIGLLPHVETTLVHARRFLEVYQERPAVADRVDAIPLRRPRGRLEFCDVTFGYGRTPVLRHLELEIPARSCVALVGESGAGKSTLAKLVPRFYDPDSGCVRLDGHDLRQYQVRSLRQQIGFAMQGGSLFCGTIRENLTFGRSIPDGDLEDAARAASIHEFISTLPAGYDTCLGEGGTNLSEGQRQRLALARVLLLNAPILILDEPTSSLDAASEEAVVQAFRTVREGRTALVIAHRPATIAEADRVVVLADGRVSEIRDRTGWCIDVGRTALPAYRELSLRWGTEATGGPSHPRRTPCTNP